MNARFARAIALAGLCLAAPTGAGAATFHVVYDATITNGFDADNIFGLAGQDLAGLGMRADVTYLTSVPGTRTTDSVSDEVTGGDGLGTSPVISSAVFTIGAKSFGFSPSYYGDVYTSIDALAASGYDILGNSFQTYILPALAGPANLQTPFSGDGLGDTGGAVTQYSYAILGNDLLDFAPTHVTVSAVPELATWALMLAGLGATGCMMRRRPRKLAAALA